jgi:hypothetical protein
MQEDAPAGSAAQMSALVETPIEDVEIIGTLGYGRNGVVFLANWRGQKVALKQFDVGKDGYEYFDKEVEAYLALEAVWGLVVTTCTPVCVRVLDRLDQVYWLAARTRSCTRGRSFGTDQRTVHFGE